MEFKWPGCVPECGAIFMSNMGTKEECFRRKLFGLPSGLAPFVKQIKVGMILFLFEFERRELHGVYQANSDGGMNILPLAYFSSGKQFPAQVKFTHLWHCSPLSEDEFGEAIKENYYSAKKFNFGLSEVQVHKLLYLFSLKKIKPSWAFCHSVEPQAMNCRPYNLEDSIIDSVPYTEPRGEGCPHFCSSLGYGAPMPSPNCYGNSQRTRMPLLESSYSGNMATNTHENEGHRGFSLPRPSPVSFSHGGNCDGMNVGTYSFSPSQYPSFVFNSEGQSQLQGLVDPVKFSSADHHDGSSLEPVVCQNSGVMYSDCQKNRKSVFSRLALAPKASIREYNTLVSRVDEESMDTSADDVMSMLHQYQWLKMRKNKQLIKVDTADFRNKRKTTSDSKLLKDHFKKISDEMRMNDVTASEESSEQLAGKTPFVDFKRRSELRKIHDSDSKIGSSGWRAETEGCAGGMQKKRKLIRPDFSKNELIDDKSINVDTPQKIEQLRILSHVRHKDNIVEAEKVSNCEVEETEETCGAAFGNVVQDGKELSKNVDIRSMPSSISVEGPTNKDSLVDGLFQDLNGSTHSSEQESSLEARERSHNGIASGEIECPRNIQELDSNAILDAANDVGMVNDSDNQATKSERVCEAVMASHCKGCKVDILQNDDGKNSVLSSGGEIITGQIPDNLKQQNTQDDPDSLQIFM